MLQVPAPSRAADSRTSAGRDSRPDNRISTTSGVHCQMSMPMVVHSAIAGSPRKFTLVPSTSYRKALMTPNSRLSMNLNERAVIVAETLMGTRNMMRNTPLP